MTEKPKFANEILSLSRPAWTQENLKTSSNHKRDCRGNVLIGWFLKRKGQK